MSAIAGIVCFDQRFEHKHECQSMLDALAVYARDGVGLWGDAHAALGICKMQVLVEDKFHDQPMVDNESGLALVADARIDNRDDLRAALEIERTSALRMADADFILAAFKRWGEDCAAHLIGDFAFAIYDRRARKLFCARDQMGMRPFFFHAGDGFFAFASMPPGLLALPRISQELDEESLARDLAVLPLVDNRTFFRKISRLLPAQCVIANVKGIQLRRYWDPAETTPLRLASDEEYVEAFRSLFDEVVRCRLRGIGEVASHLSGGLDSSSVTATAARILGAAGRELISFTAVPREGFDGAELPHHFGNEGPRAAALAAMYPNIEHILMPSNVRSFLDHLEPSQRLMASPVRNPSNIEWAIAINQELNRRGIRILLTGILGNATISYSGVDSLSGLFRSGRWITMLREARALRQTQNYSLAGITNIVMEPSLPGWIRRPLERIKGIEPWRYSVINRQVVEEFGLKPLSEVVHDRKFSRPRLNSRSVRSYMLNVNDQGPYAFAFNSATGIDLRDPTADKRVAEFCFAIPDRQFLHAGVTRRLVRRAMTRALPESTLQERFRGLQASDWYEGMRASKARIFEEIRLIEGSARARRLLDIDRMRALMADWPSGSRGTAGEAFSLEYRQGLQRGLAVGNFIRCFEKD